MAKKRVYPERVTASMMRIIHEDEVLLMRHSTTIHFGNSDDLLGVVIMTNPGKFEFKHSPKWEEFKNGEGASDVFKSADYPDLSMQNVIEVIRAGFAACRRSEPKGILRVYNLSNVRQPDGQKAETYHDRAKSLLSSDEISLLEDPITHNREQFMTECAKAKFVIMGFVQGAFDQKMQQVRAWSNELNGNGLVVALDNNDHFTRPRRWRTDRQLKQQAIESMISVLQR
ncbi:hypothetical protein [Paenibacillus sp. JDR-2]|uniref:hypothetical protein n=1 Tax=Paenibacillus sp. (strain JDR-2) TaxID=324057 RepID=UPI0001668D86|nr:hypothetical protein [Paenibacillus sp. JDR-2]ACT03360.1 hypothetical protein Pjdr2_4747 [Paenibacillus sp. JDR-2]